VCTTKIGFFLPKMAAENYWVRTADERGRPFFYHTQRHVASWEAPLKISSDARSLEAVLERVGSGTAGSALIRGAGPSWLPAADPAGTAEHAAAVAQIDPLVSGEMYRATATFSRGGRFGVAGDHFERKGIASDKAGRQLSSFFDVDSLEENRAQAARQREQLRQRKDIDWKEVKKQKTASKRRKQSEWLRTE
jgi:hypothetical protein